MDVMKAIQLRREITEFTAEPIPPAVKDQLVQALALSPTGNNLPSREFIWVDDKPMQEILSGTSPYMKWLNQTAAAVVLIGNPAVSKYWLQDATIAASFLWLAAVDNGLGAAWGAVYHSEDAEESARRENHVRTHLNIPEEYRVVAIIGLGYAAAGPKPKTMIPLERIYHEGMFSRRQS